jgi:hypothetical protein
MSVNPVSAVGAGDVETCFARSLAALGRHAPALAAAIKNSQALLPPVCSGVQPIDIDLGQGTLYRGDGQAVAAEQIARFREKPFRFYVNDLTGANLGSEMAMRLVKRLTAHLAAERVGPLDAMPSHDGAILFVLGLGLGYHVPALIGDRRLRHIVIVEPHLEFLRHSLSAIDWQELFAAAASHGQQIHIVGGDHPDKIMAALAPIIQANGVALIDGSFVFLHYQAQILLQVRERLWQWVDRAFIANGFYEDELIMVRNAFANLARADFFLVDNTPRLMRPEPLFVIGSGPSVDKALPHINRWRAQAIVVSCGTALRVCLANGVVPDFHAELENGPVTRGLVERVQGEFALEGISLFGSLTVDPGVPPLFEERFLFFRDSVTPTRMLADRKLEILGAAPTVANTALAIAAALGFVRVYLFGVDCGYREGLDHRHSASSPYGIDAALRDKDRKIQYPLAVPGNFGGIVRTNWLFDLSRRLLSDLIRLKGLRAFNCSDGGRIESAVPKLVETIHLDGPVLDRAQIKAELRRSLRQFNPAEFFATRPPERMIEQAEALLTETSRLLADAESEDSSFVQLHDRLEKFFAERRRTAGTAEIIASTLQTLAKIGMFFAHRLKDKAAERSLRCVFYDEYRTIFADMKTGALGLLADCANELRRLS